MSVDPRTLLLLMDSNLQDAMVSLRSVIRLREQLSKELQKETTKRKPKSLEKKQIGLK